MAYNCPFRGTFCSWNSSAMGLRHHSNQKFLSKAVFWGTGSPKALWLPSERTILTLCKLPLVDIWDSLHTSFWSLTSSGQAEFCAHRKSLGGLALPSQVEWKFQRGPTVGPGSLESKVSHHLEEDVGFCSHVRMLV